MSFVENDHDTLLARYEEIAKSGDHRTTASDYQLRELEIEYASRFIQGGDDVLDVGCGMGYALSKYAHLTSGQLLGLDYSAAMIGQASEFLASQGLIPGRAEVMSASVTEIPMEDCSVDIVTSHRCLMALLQWDLQQAALREIHRVLRPGGRLILMEGTIQGLERLNEIRTKVGLDAIPDDGRDRLLTRKFDEVELLEFVSSYFTLLDRQGFGLYYFIGRVVHPLLVAPDEPSYDHPINAVARTLQMSFPGLVDCGHLQAFTLEKLGP